MEELKSKHKKEIRSFEGEKRNGLKKTKGSAGKGKKGKEALAKAEQEWDEKEKLMLERHATELSSLEISEGQQQQQGEDQQQQPPPSTTQETQSTAEADTPQLTAKQKAQAKKAKKRQQQRDKERALEAEREKEIADSGPSPRDVELQQIMQRLSLSSGDANKEEEKQRLEIEEVQADGNCLYRAVAVQFSRLPSSIGDRNRDTVGEGFIGMRKLCAQILAENKEEYEPFCDLEGLASYDNYVEMVRDSSEWGGHLELRALATGLGKTIVVYSADAPPLYISGSEAEGKADNDEKELIRLSFHRRYYALGEHYNSVVSVEEE